MRFTIGIPAYKATYLKECIDSIMAQTYTDFELIVVNDASPQNIDEIVNSYGSGKIRYYKNEVNFGAAHVVDNWNKCLSHASGDFFILMGDDDKLHPDYLSVFDALINKYPLCNVYHCRSLIINEQGLPIKLTEPWPEFESVYDTVLQRVNGKRVFFISDFVYRASILKSNGGYYKLPLAWASDDISSFIAAQQNGIASTNRPVFMYRQNPHTITNNGNAVLKIDAILGEERWLNNFAMAKPADAADLLLRDNIIKEIPAYITRRKIWTIYSSQGFGPAAYIKWLKLKNEYRLSVKDLLFALVLNFKDKFKRPVN